MKILLTFTGFHDPYFESLVAGEEQIGPVLSILSAKSFDKVILFATPNTGGITAATESAIIALYSEMVVEVLDVPLDDPTNYSAILKSLRLHISNIQERQARDSFYVAVASGTPQMHACWFLLCASGEIAATILHVRPPRFVTKSRPLVSEVDIVDPQFPVVRVHRGCQMIGDETPVDLMAGIQKVGIIGDHPLMNQAMETAALLAPSDAPVLVLGETGTGKELFSKLIHVLSTRSVKPFVAVNCAAIPENLVESLLFGHKKGSFTGAIADHPGKFDEANGGTLFLDELGELPLSAQVKLLRVLNDGMVETIGEGKPHKVDVRIVCATHQNLPDLVAAGRFRSDLYYRLNVGEVSLPSLQDRRSDIPKLALSILDRINSNQKRKKRLSTSALKRLQQHTWSGNVRELANAIERSMLLCRSDVLEADDLFLQSVVSLSDPLDNLPEPAEGFSMEGFLKSSRKQLILRALEIAGGNQSKAARLLGITPQAVYKFLKSG